MPPKHHDGFVRGGRLGCHGDHLNAVKVVDIELVAGSESHRCLQDRPPLSNMQRKVWACCLDPVGKLIEQLAVHSEWAIFTKQAVLARRMCRW